MPPRPSDDTPAALRPFLALGADLRVAGSQAVGGCPLCGHGGDKFFVGLEDRDPRHFAGGWGCKSCGESGNLVQFLRAVHAAGVRGTTRADYEELAADRGLVDPDTLPAWGVCRSPVTGDWLVPGYGTGGKVDQVYRYRAVGGDGKRRLLCGPSYRGADGRDVGHSLHWASPPRPGQRVVWVCEGPWDGMALWEALGRARRGDAGLVPTSARPSSIAATEAVLAVPGCTTFFPEWGRVLAGRDVVLAYDSDHPRKHPTTGADVGVQGWRGAERAAGVLLGGAAPPASVRVVRWGPDGYDPGRPSGWDVRDHLGSRGESVRDRVAALDDLVGRVEVVPAGWGGPRTAQAVAGGKPGADLLPCDRWDDLVGAWRKALHWTEGLDRALSVILASCLSTDSAGDQLWVKVIGPPSCGKTVLCEAVSTCREYVYPKDTLTGLVSGYQVDREGSENVSLAPRLKGKTLVVNDGDTVLQLPNLPQVLSQLRAFYGRNIRTQYGNRMSADHECISATVVLCGTNALRALDSSELGERMLDCVVLDEIDDDLEEEVGLRKAYDALRDVRTRANGSQASMDGPEMSRAKLMTGGYVRWLRTAGADRLRDVDLSDDALRACTALGKYVALMRGRPSSRQVEKHERELCYRLTSQVVRLAACLTVVRNLRTPDRDVMARVVQVCRDTARGRVLRYADVLAGKGGTGPKAAGLEAGSLAAWVDEDEAEVRKLLKFLRAVRVVRAFRPTLHGSVRGKVRYALTDRTAALCRRVADLAGGKGAGVSREGDGATTVPGRG